MASLQSSRLPVYNFDDISNSGCCEESEKIDKGAFKIPLCPRLTLSFLSVPVRALLDTGSQITAISESFYNYLKLHGTLTEFPVTNVSLFTAIGKKQILCEIQVGGEKCSSYFLVVPNLSNMVILGNDWFAENRAKIDYQKFIFMIRDKVFHSPTVSFDKIISETSTTTPDDDIIYVQSVKQFRDLNIENSFGNKNDKEKGKLRKCDEVDSNDVLGDGCFRGMSHLMNDIHRYDKTVAGVSDSSRESIEQTNTHRNSDSADQNNELNEFRDNIIYETDFTLDELKNNKIINEIDIMYDEKERVVTNSNDFIKNVHMIAESQTGLIKLEKNRFIEMLSKFEKLFTAKLSSADVEPYRIRVKSHTQFIRKTYPIPLKFRNSTDKTMNSMVDAGIIERADCSYCSPLRIIVKKDGSVRVCLDARFVNDIIESDHESPPLIDEIMQQFHGINFMTLSDLASGYWQIPLHSDSRKYTAFLYNSQMYQFCRIPFGLKTAGSAFMRAISMALGDRFKDFLTVYVDDFLIATRGSFEDHLNSVESVFTVLQEKNFTLSLTKSLFCKEQVNFLGYELTKNGIRPVNEKLESISNFECPKNQKQLQPFLGICNYYRQFTERHCDLIHPFRDLLKGKSTWKWTRMHEQAFVDIKKAFVQCIRLSHYIPDSMYYLQTDASDLGVSGILFQYDSDENKRVVAMVSRCLNVAEVNYTTTEKELLAIVYSITKFRMYLSGQPFEIITDHKSLTFLNTTPFLTSRLVRWSIFLQSFDFKVSHCRGKENVVADFLSRNPRGKFESIQSNDLSIDVLACNECDYEKIDVICEQIILKDEIKQELKNLLTLQNSDPYIKNIIDKIKADQHLDFYTIREGVLFRRDAILDLWQVVIPSELASRLVDCVHSKLGHPGVYKTMMYLRQHYYWQYMNREIKNFVLRCDLCQRVKYNNFKMEGTFNMVKSDAPGDLICVDFYGPLPRSIGGLEYVFVVMDMFSKYVKLYPIKRENCETILRKIFESYIPEMGTPRRILADHGTQFTTPKWSKKLREAGIQVVHSSIRHPKSNPVERVMRELGRFFRTLCADKHTRWAKHIQDIEFLLNITSHHSTGFAPIELHFNKKILRPD